MELDGVARIGAGALREALGVVEAVDALEGALRGGLDPAADPPRPVLGFGAGQLLVMPATHGGFAGVKLATVAPDSPGRTVPRIQGVYVLFDAVTLVPVALLDGPALTTLRTPAVSALAVRHLAAPDARRMVVFGTGPQAWGHVEALRAVRPVGHVDVVGRDPGRRDAFVARCRAAGVPADPAGEGTAAVAAVVAAADLVVCATTSPEPLFAGEVLSREATVVAVGSHQPAAREVDGETVRRGTVVVEDPAVALREAGDVIAAISAGVVDATHLHALADLVTGAAGPIPGRPRLFKSVGMAWEDLVVATAAYLRTTSAPATSA